MILWWSLTADEPVDVKNKWIDSELKELRIQRSDLYSSGKYLEGSDL